METENQTQPEPTEPQGTEVEDTGAPAPDLAEDQPGESAAPTDGGEPAAKPKKKGFQERLGELTRKRREAERSAEQLAEENARLKAQLEGSQPSKKEEPAAAKPPVETDFEDYSDFLAAKARHEARQEIEAENRRREEQQQQTAQQEQSEKQRAEFFQRCEAASETYEDFVEVAFNTDLQVNQTMTEVIMGAENGPDIAYWLGSNPKEAERISQLPPTLAAMEMGKIGAAIKRPEPKKTTNAPDPLEPVGSGERAQKHLYDEDDYEEYKRRRMAN
ncbi:MAG: hypothetical protein ACPH3N_00760 [Alcanivorax sediminis]|uniref:hypothetical protein n=1 Tax=Alcanivorax sediminis TaxID=2663008 RepID=UPI003C3BB772